MQAKNGRLSKGANKNCNIKGAKNNGTVKQILQITPLFVFQKWLARLVQVTVQNCVLQASNRGPGHLDIFSKRLKQSEGNSKLNFST